MIICKERKRFPHISGFHDKKTCRWKRTPSPLRKRNPKTIPPSKKKPQNHPPFEKETPKPSPLRKKNPKTLPPLKKGGRGGFHQSPPWDPLDFRRQPFIGRPKVAKGPLDAVFHPPLPRTRSGVHFNRLKAFRKFPATHLLRLAKIVLTIRFLSWCTSISKELLVYLSSSRSSPFSGLPK
jgi:hypothetical protein